MRKARLCGPGLRFVLERRVVLEAAELEVQASPDHGKVVAIATVVAEADELAVDHRGAGVGHADHVAAPEGAIAITVPVEADVQAFDLRSHVVEAQEAAGEGILDAAAYRVPEVIIPAIIEEAEAGVGRPLETTCERSGIVNKEPRAEERRAVRDAAAEAAEAEVVVAITVLKGDTAGAVDHQAIDRIAEPATHGGEPVHAVVVVEAAVEAVAAAVEQRHVAECAVANPGRTGNARASSNGSDGGSREDAVSAAEAAEPAKTELVVMTTAEVGVLDVGFDTEHEAGARRELEVVADLTAAHEAVALVTIAKAVAEAVKPGQRHHRCEASIGLHGQAAAEVVEAEGIVVSVAGVKTVTRVHADVEAGPGEHRNRNVRDRSRSNVLTTRQVGRQS